MTNEIQQRAEQRAMEAMNRIFGNMMVSKEARWRYYQNKETKDRYFYTTEKINHKGTPRYAAGIYRYLKSKKQWKMVKQVGFAKKKRAIEWARKSWEAKK